MMTVTEFAARIAQCWSIQTATVFESANPAKGQCSVTALVAQDILGGDILKTDVGGSWHFYNRIAGDRHDFTAAQFAGPIRYDDVPGNREEAFADTTVGQYAALSRIMAGCH